MAVINDWIKSFCNNFFYYAIKLHSNYEGKFRYKCENV